MFYKVASNILKPIVYLCLGLKVEGRENLETSGPLIICGNHSSYWDIPLLCAVFKRQIHFIAKKELFDVPVLGLIIKKAGSFPVSRNKVDLSAMKNAINVLKSDEVLGIFPEGTRMKSDEAGSAKSGISMFAYKGSASILPCHIEYKRKGHFLFGRTKVVFGKVIPYEDLGFDKKPSKEELENVVNDVMKKIYSLGE